MIVNSSDSTLSVIVVETSVQSLEVGNVILSGGFSLVIGLPLPSTLTGVALGQGKHGLQYNPSLSLSNSPQRVWTKPPHPGHLWSGRNSWVGATQLSPAQHLPIGYDI